MCIPYALYIRTRHPRNKKTITQQIIRSATGGLEERNSVQTCDNHSDAKTQGDNDIRHEMNRVSNTGAERIKVFRALAAQKCHVERIAF